MTRRRRPRAAIAGTLVLALAGAVALVAAGCAEPSGQPSSSPVARSHPAELRGSEWQVISLAGLIPADPSRPTIAFTGDEIRGSSGCNHFSGTYRYDGATGSLAMNQLATTDMACDPARSALEAAFHAAVGGANLVTLDADGRLVITGTGGVLVLVPGQAPGAP